jgi:hypothetical protein
MELRWKEPEMGGGGAPASSPIKLVCLFFDEAGIAAVLLLSREMRRHPLARLADRRSGVLEFFLPLERNTWWPLALT